MAIDPEVNKILDNLKSTGTALQTSLSNLKTNTDVASPDPSLQTAQDNITKSLTSAISSSDFQDQSKTLMEKYAQRRTLAETAAAAERDKINAQATGSIDQAQQEGALSTETARESSRNLGLASSRALIIQEQQKTDKRIKDLTQTRDELLAQNKVNEASQIDNLITQEQTTITQARQSYLTNLFNLSSEIRGQEAAKRDAAAFETPEQKRQRDLATEQQKNLDTLKSQYADIPGMANATDIPSALKLLGPRLSEDRKYAIAKQDSELRLQNAQTNLANANARKATADLNNGSLDPTDLVKIDNSPQGKAINSLLDTKVAAEHYLALLNQYGYQFGGAGKTLLEGAYADLLVKWKSTAALGALSASDYDLLSKAIAPSTGFSGAASMLTGGGTEGIKGQIQQLIDSANKSGSDAYAQLLKRDPRYKNSEYVQGLGMPFLNQQPAAPGAQKSLTNTNTGTNPPAKTTGVGQIGTDNLFFNVLTNPPNVNK